MFRSIVLPELVFVNRTFRAPVVWMVVTPLLRVNVARTSLLVVTSNNTGKLQGFCPCVSVKMNGSVGSGFGCLVGGAAAATEAKLSPANNTVQSVTNASRRLTSPPNSDVLNCCPSLSLAATCGGHSECAERVP